MTTKLGNVYMEVCYVKLSFLLVMLKIICNKKFLKLYLQL